MHRKPVLRVGFAGLIATLVVAGSGCAASPEGRTVADDLAELTTTVQPVWTFPAHPVGEPTVANGVALAYVYEDEKIQLVAVDVESGDELWRERASIGGIQPRTTLHPIVTIDDGFDPVVVMLTPPSLAPGSGFGHRIRLLEPRSGELLHEVGPGFVVDPRHCHTTAGVCFEASAGAGIENRSYRLDVATGEVSEYTDSLQPGRREAWLGFGLYVVDEGGRDVLIDVGDDDVDTADRDTAAHPNWSLPLTEVLGESRSVFDGFRTSEFRDDVLLLGVNPRESARAEHGRDSRIVAVDTTDGTVLWTTEGWSVCSASMRCAGEWTAEVEAGSEHAGRAAAEQTTASMRYEGFDLRTGEATWSLTIADQTNDESGERRFASLAAGRVIADGGRAQVLDTVSGELHELPEGAALVCRDETSIMLHKFSNPLGEVVEHRMGAVAAPCDERGQTVEGYSRAAIRGASSSWAPEDDAWQDASDGAEAARLIEEASDAAGEPERWRVLQTADALLGFRF